MKIETQELLKQLGFKHVTATIWQHIGTKAMTSFTDDSEPYDVGMQLIEMGENIKIAEIKDVLKIKH